MTQSLIRQEVRLWTTNGINGSMANPGRAPILQTKSVTKKQMNKCMAEIRIGAGFKLRTPGRKANNLTTEPKRYLPDAVARYCI